MIRSSNGVRLLSSHLIRDACRSIYQGVFHTTVDSGVWTLSRVRGHGTVNPNNRVLPNTSIRGSVSLSRADYEISYVPGYSPIPPIDGVSEADFQEGFEDFCKRYNKIFSSEGEKDYMFKWFCDHFPYGRLFSFGCAPRSALIDHIRKYGNVHTKISNVALLEKLRQAPAFPPDDEEDTTEVYCSNKLSWDELDEYKAKCCSRRRRYIGSGRLTDIERETL